jgi:hypothetical protein
MADEFIKGLGIFVVAGLGWVTLASWYRTPSFEGAQLYGAVTGAPTMFDQIGVILMNGLAWFAIIGALTFWVVIPGIRQVRGALSDEG